MISMVELNRGRHHHESGSRWLGQSRRKVGEEGMVLGSLSITSEI